METVLFLKFFSAFVFVISLMLLLSWGMKKMGLPGSVMMPGARRRLKIVEYLPLDHRRRMVLIRRDNKDHLLILGPNGETVVETGIPMAEENVIELKVEKNVKT